MHVFTKREMPDSGQISFFFASSAKKKHYWLLFTQIEWHKTVLCCAVLQFGKKASFFFTERDWLSFSSIVVAYQTRSIINRRRNSVHSSQGGRWKGGREPLLDCTDASDSEVLNLFFFNPCHPHFQDHLSISWPTLQYIGCREMFQ